MSWTEDLWFIKTRNKRPVEGGWGWEFAELGPWESRDSVYSFDEAVEMEWHEFGAISHVDWNLGIIDIDWTNAVEAIGEEETLELYESLELSEAVPIVHSQSSVEIEGITLNNAHYYFGYDFEANYRSSYDFIDLKGDLGKGFTVCPPSPGYELVNDYGLPIFAVEEELEGLVTFDGEPVVHKAIDRASGGTYTGGENPSIYELISESEFPVGMRVGHPFHASSTNTNFRVDSDEQTFRCEHHNTTGNVFHLIGIKHGVCECGDWDDGLDSSQYAAMYRIAQEEYGLERDSSGYLGHVLASDSDGNVKDRIEPPEDLSPTEPFSGVTPARGGKSTSLAKNVARILDEGYEGNILWGASSHDEGAATVDKLNSLGVRAAHLVGKRNERAQDISSTGEFVPHDAVTPAEASLIENGNAYSSYVDNCAEAQVLVTHPSLFDKAGDRDLFITAEEQCIDGMEMQPISLMKATRVYPNDRDLSFPIMRLRPQLQAERDRIEDLDQRDEHHRAVQSACSALLDVTHVLEDWQPGSWTQVMEEWDGVRDECLDRLRRIPSFDVVPSKIRRYVNDQLEDEVCAVLWLESEIGYNQYGSAGFDEDGNPLSREIHCFVEPEPYTPKFETLVGANIWVHVSSIRRCNELHATYSSEIPEGENIRHIVKDLTEGDLQLFVYTGGDNPSEQTGHIRQLFRDVQRRMRDVSILAVSGSSQRSAEMAAAAMQTHTPNSHDDVETLRRNCQVGSTTCAPVTSRFMNGIDTPFFDMGVVDHCYYAAPAADFKAELSQDPKIAEAHKLADVQNAVLRTSNTPSEGHRDTPVVIPSRHIPSALVPYLEHFGFTVHMTDDMELIAAHIVALLDRSGDVVVRDGRIQERREGDAARMSWDTFTESTGLR